MDAGGTPQPCLLPGAPQAIQPLLAGFAWPRWPATWGCGPPGLTVPGAPLPLATSRASAGLVPTGPCCPPPLPTLALHLAPRASPPRPVPHPAPPGALAAWPSPASAQPWRPQQPGSRGLSTSPLGTWPIGSSMPALFASWPSLLGACAGQLWGAGVCAVLFRGPGSQQPQRQEATSLSA